VQSVKIKVLGVVVSMDFGRVNFSITLDYLFSPILLAGVVRQRYSVADYGYDPWRGFSSSLPATPLKRKPSRGCLGSGLSILTAEARPK
jgi:hypothetical protein